MVLGGSYPTSTSPNTTQRAEGKARATQAGVGRTGQGGQGRAQGGAGRDEAGQGRAAQAVKANTNGMLVFALTSNVRMCRKNQQKRHAQKT